MSHPFFPHIGKQGEWPLKGGWGSLPYYWFLEDLFKELIISLHILGKSGGKGKGTERGWVGDLGRLNWSREPGEYLPCHWFLQTLPQRTDHNIAACLHPSSRLKTKITP